MKKTITVVLVALVLALTRGGISSAAWISEGLTGRNISIVSGGATRAAVEPITNTIWLKVNGTWKGFPVTGVNTVFSDQTSGMNFIASNTEVYREENGSLYSISQCTDERCVNTYFNGATTGTVADGQVYAIGSDGTPYVCPSGISTGIWSWEHRTNWNISGVNTLGSFENRLFAANDTGLFREATVGNEDFGSIAALTAPASAQNIAGHSSGIYVSNSLANTDRVFWDGSAWQEVSITNTNDAKADNNLTFVLGTDGIIYKTADGNTLTAVESLIGVSINSINVYSGSLYAATSDGVYRLDMRPSSTTTVSATISGANINVSWNAVAGATGYKIYYGASYTAYSVVDVGLVTSYQIPATGVNVLWVVSYNSDQYESVATYKQVCNPLDTLPPASITDLRMRALGPNSVLAEWTEPPDNYLTASFDLRRSSVAITSRNWATATQIAGKPTPTTPGASKSMVVGSLSPDTLYYFTVRASDSCNRISAIYNSVSVRTLSTGTKMVGFGHGDSDRATGYETCCGTTPGAYTACQDVGMTNPSYVLMSDSGETQYCTMRAYNQYGYTASNEMLIIP